MAVGLRGKDGRDADDMFDPDVVGDGPTFEGHRRPDGSFIRYAHIRYGSKAVDIGTRDKDGTDISNKWAAKGTAVYAMNVDGRTFASNNQSRGTACIRFNIYSNGTFDVQDWRSTTQQAVLASGTWLPQGDAVGDWTVQISAVTRNEGTVSGGTNGAETNANSQQSCTSDHFGRTYSFSATTVQRANCDGTIVVQLYKNGQLRSTTSIYTYQNVNGN